MSSSYLFFGTKTFDPPAWRFGFQGLSEELEKKSGRVEKSKMTVKIENSFAEKNFSRLLSQFIFLTDVIQLLSQIVV